MHKVAKNSGWLLHGKKWGGDDHKTIPDEKRFFEMNGKPGSAGIIGMVGLIGDMARRNRPGN